MRGPVCLQGGAEFSPGCEAMDETMLAADDGSPRSVRVLPFAAAAGREREVAAGNARRWYTALGARDVTAVTDEDGVAEALSGAPETTLVVLPGGSPHRLLQALAPHAERLAAALRSGVSVSGASAGAMVLCRWTVLPGGGSLRVVPALGVVDVDLVLPHFVSGRTAWLDAAGDTLPPDRVVLGLPERSGVILAPGGVFEPAGERGYTRL